MKFDRSNPKAIGYQSFKLEKCEFKGSFFSEGMSEYIPLGVIIGNNPNGNLSMGFSQGSYYAPSQLEKKRRKWSAAFQEQVSVKPKDSGIHRVAKDMTSSEDGSIKSLMDAYKKAIDSFLTKKCGYELPERPSRYEKATYQNLLRTVFGSQIRDYYFQSIRSITVGPGFVYSHPIKDFIFCLVVPESLIHYQRLYFLLNGEFDPKGMEFWVNDRFDVPKSEYKSFRQSYRKSIKPKMEEWGIGFVTKNRIVDEMVPTFNMPSALDELDLWKEKIARETLLTERAELEFDFS